MNYIPFPIYDMKFGKATQKDPWLLPKDAFKKLENCHLKRGILEKRRGYSEFGKMVKTSNTTASSITHFADATGGKVTVTTSSAHGLSNGNTAVITGTTSYNGTFIISEKAATTFKITATFVADDATGVVSLVEGLTVMGLENHLNGATETLLAFDTTRINKYASSAFSDMTRIKVHVKTVAGQNAAPTTGVTVEGLTSGHTGVVESVVLDNGSWIDGTAHGTIIFTRASVSDAFHNAETLVLAGDHSKIYGQADGASEEQLFTGSDDDFFSITNWEDIGYICNGVDQIQKYDGTSLSRLYIDLDVEGGPDNDVTAVKFIFPYYGRLLLLSMTERGVACTRRARYSNIDDPQIWSDADYLDNTKTNDYIVSTKIIKGDLYVRFTNSLWLLAYTGDSDLPFRWEMIASEGSSASHSMVIYNSKLINVSKTNIIETDGRNSYSIDIKIPDDMLAWNLAYIKYCYGINIESEKQILISYTSRDATVPDSAILINYEDQSFADYTIPVHVFGSSILSSDLILDEIEDVLDTLDYSFDASDIQAGYPIILMGCRTGYIYQLNSGGTDNNSAIEFNAESAQWNPFITEGYKAALGWIDFLVDMDGDVTFDIVYYRNTDSSPTGTTRTVTCDGDYSEDGKVWKRVYFNSVATFHTINITNNASTNRPRIHAIVPYFARAERINN